MVDYTFTVFARFLRPGRILEMGPAEGLMTQHLANVATELTVVEGAGSFCTTLSARFPKIHVVHSLFEDFEPAETFDNIVLGHVLEHVEDPTMIVKRASSWLRPGGRILAAVPNARSLHRQAAVIMGLIAHEAAMNEMDLHHGHRRVFNPENFRQVFHEAGMRINFFGGYWLKPVSNAQIESSWSGAMLDSFMQLGERYPDIAADIYLIASR
jgi:2-polyprenyl-3-methyl-5-hydroxy-6-metoxy-1,4-benzoquinol methylase